MELERPKKCWFLSQLNVFHFILANLQKYNYNMSDRNVSLIEVAENGNTTDVWHAMYWKKTVKNVQINLQRNQVKDWSYLLLGISHNQSVLFFVNVILVVLLLLILLVLFLFGKQASFKITWSKSHILLNANRYIT